MSDDLPKAFWTAEEHAAAMSARADDDRVAELEEELAQEREKNERLSADSDFWQEEARFLRVELTKVNNIVQPVWGELRALREEADRDLQTGEAAAQPQRDAPDGAGKENER